MNLLREPIALSGPEDFFFFLRRGLSLQIPFIHKTLNLSDLPFLPISALVTGVFLFISSKLSSGLE